MSKMWGKISNDTGWCSICGFPEGFRRTHGFPAVEDGLPSPEDGLPDIEDPRWSDDDVRLLRQARSVILERNHFRRQCHQLTEDLADLRRRAEHMEVALLHISRHCDDPGYVDDLAQFASRATAWPAEVAVRGVNIH